MIIVENVRPDDFESWRAHPITQRVFAAIQEVLDRERADAGRGEGLDRDNANHTQASAFERKGKCNALEDVVTMTVEVEKKNKPSDD